MKFIDPIPIVCPNCGESREYPVNDLLNLRAFCSVCSHDLSSIGKEMNATSDHWRFVLTYLMDFILKLEARLGIQYEDTEVEHLSTLDEVFRLTSAKLPPDYSSGKLEQQILEVASEVGHYQVNQLHLGMKLAEAFGRS